MSSVTICNQPFEFAQGQLLSGLLADPTIKLCRAKAGRKTICQGRLVQEIRGSLSIGAVLAETVRDNVLDRDHQDDRSLINPYHAQEPTIGMSVEQGTADALHADPQRGMVQTSQQMTATILPSKAAGDQRRLDWSRVNHDKVKVA
jgi:hypothetical protein